MDRFLEKQYINVYTHVHTRCRHLLHLQMLLLHLFTFITHPVNELPLNFTKIHKDQRLVMQHCVLRWKTVLSTVYSSVTQTEVCGLVTACERLVTMSRNNNPTHNFDRTQINNVRCALQNIKMRTQHFTVLNMQQKQKYSCNKRWQYLQNINFNRPITCNIFKLIKSVGPR